MSGVEKNTKGREIAQSSCIYKKELNSKGGLFVYLKSSFSPNLNEQIGVLLDSFGTDVGDTRKLVLHYALSPAWG
eukprot:jgi/Picre1/32065/NNA_007413.t1